MSSLFLTGRRKRRTSEPEKKLIPTEAETKNPTENPKQKYECQDCWERFSILRNFRSHILLHEDKKKEKKKQKMCQEYFFI